jgi:hypothetical protein
VAGTAANAAPTTSSGGGGGTQAGQLLNYLLAP